MNKDDALRIAIARMRETVESRIAEVPYVEIGMSLNVGCPGCGAMMVVKDFDGETIGAACPDECVLPWPDMNAAVKVSL